MPASACLPPRASRDPTHSTASCPAPALQLLRLLGLPPEWLALLTADPQAAPIHVLSMGGEQLHEQALADRIQGSRWRRVVAVRPTGARVCVAGVAEGLHVQCSAG